METRPWLLMGPSRKEAKDWLGHIIYPKIHWRYPIYPALTGKITGMILDAHSVKELDELLDNETQFWIEVKKALHVLAARLGVVIPATP